MRKDLKIGMAIGAVLLAVLVVYFAMPKPEDGGGEFAGAGDTAVAAADGPAVGGDPVAPSAEAGPSARLQQDGTGADATASSVANAGKAKRDVFAPDADATTGDEGDDDADADAAEGDAGGTNWAKLLEMGDSGDIVRTETPATPTADAAKASDTQTGTSIPRLAASRRETNGEDASTASPTPGGVSAGPAAGSTASASPARSDDTSSDSTPQSDGDAAAVATPAAPSATGARTHKVKAGENYSTIAKAVYGHSRYYLAIEKANPDIDPTRIRPGTEIKLPDPATVKGSGSSSTVAAAEATDAAPRAIDPDTEYRVKPNDNLHDIAVAKYGSSTMADKIYELNQQAIGSDPAKLKLGMILKLPPGAKQDETVASDE